MSAQDRGSPPQWPPPGPQRSGPPRSAPDPAQTPPPPPQWPAGPSNLAQTAIVAAGAALRPRPKSLAGVTTVLWLALAAEALVAVLGIAAYTWRLLVIRALMNGTFMPWTRVAASNHFVDLVARLWGPVVLVGCVVFLIWVHEARANLGAFRWGPFAYSQGWAIGAFLIPILNLCLPPLVVREIWKASDPALSPFAPAPFSTRPASPLIVLWWASFLCADAVALVATLLASGADRTLSLLRLVADLRVAMCALVLTFVALTFVLAREIGRRQDILARQVPPPPTWVPRPAAPPWAVAAQPTGWPSAPPSTPDH